MPAWPYREKAYRRKNVMHCGMEAEVIEFFDSRHVIIRFANGETAGVAYGEFQKGRCIPPSINRNYAAIKRAQSKYLHKKLLQTMGKKWSASNIAGDKIL